MSSQPRLLELGIPFVILTKLWCGFPVVLICGRTVDYVIVQSGANTETVVISSTYKMIVDAF